MTHMKSLVWLLLAGAMIALAGCGGGGGGGHGGDQDPPNPIVLSVTLPGTTTDPVILNFNTFIDAAADSLNNNTISWRIVDGSLFVEQSRPILNFTLVNSDRGVSILPASGDWTNGVGAGDFALLYIPAAFDNIENGGTNQWLHSTEPNYIVNEYVQAFDIDPVTGPQLFDPAPLIIGVDVVSTTGVGATNGLATVTKNPTPGPGAGLMDFGINCQVQTLNGDNVCLRGFWNPGLPDIAGNYRNMTPVGGNPNNVTVCNYATTKGNFTTLTFNWRAYNDIALDPNLPGFLGPDNGTGSQASPPNFDPNGDGLPDIGTDTMGPAGDTNGDLMFPDGDGTSLLLIMRAMLQKNQNSFNEAQALPQPDIDPSVVVDTR